MTDLKLLFKLQKPFIYINKDVVLVETLLEEVLIRFGVVRCFEYPFFSQYIDAL